MSDNDEQQRDESYKLNGELLLKLVDLVDNKFEHFKGCLDLRNDHDVEHEGHENLDDEQD